MALDYLVHLAAHYDLHCLCPRDYNRLLPDLEVEPRSQTTLYSYAFETDPVPVRVVKSYLKRSRVYASYLVETLLIGRWSDLWESSCSANYKDPDAGTGSPLSSVTAP